MTKKVLTIVGARPQFVKAAMLSKAFATDSTLAEVVVHTGQHYDENMSAIFFDQMGIAPPTYNLEVGSASHAVQIARILEKLDTVFVHEKPDATLVYGDTNSTLAGAICSVRHGVPVIHVEAGMRSYNKYQPEENNRVLTDHASELLLCSSAQSQQNLAKEGITDGVFVTGDIMYDSTLAFASQPSTILADLGLHAGTYVFVTCHRPESTDTPEHLRAIVSALLTSKQSIVFPVHPRTRKCLTQYDLLASLQNASHVHLIEPVGYIDSLHLQKHARIVLTDSGGVQKEAYFLGVPCITVRDFTEWTELVEAGWNIVTGYDPQAIRAAITDFKPPQHRPALFGEGKAAAAMHARIQAFLSSISASKS